MLAKYYFYVEKRAVWLQQSSAPPNALDTLASGSSLLKARQKKGEWIFSFKLCREFLGAFVLEKRLAAL